MERSINLDIEGFINKIASVSDVGQLFYNPYHREACRYNLKNYMYHLLDDGVDIMLIGEAPGYRGCALTGIPFTDEVQLKSSLNNYALGTWQRLDETGNTSERSASAMWSALRKYHITPLMWNAFPFHPYQAGNISSNRTPTQAELKDGLTYIQELISIFDIDSTRIFAIGQKAKSMIGLKDDSHCIRHPANDFKKEFHPQFDWKVGKLFCCQKSHIDVEKAVEVTN